MTTAISLDDRELTFLRESNAIEDIENIDYALPENAQPDLGHVGAFGEMRDAACRKRSIALDDVCRWQSMIAEEQRRFGHEIPATGVGQLRGERAPFNVRVGSHFAPEYQAVAGLMATWLSDLHARMAERGGTDLIHVADVLGELFQRFEAIHPFVDGNGRTGRLVANYVAMFLGVPLIVFRASERPDFYAAHHSKPVMKLFMLQKLREVAVHPMTGKLLRRVRGDAATDIYRDDSGREIVAEQHRLVPAIEDWSRLAAEKERSR
jgi:hypothetical protein